MDDNIIKETAEELDIPIDDVRDAIRAMEELVLNNIKRSSVEEIYSTRIMGFGTFEGISDKAITRYRKRYEDKKNASGSDV